MTKRDYSDRDESLIGGMPTWFWTTAMPVVSITASLLVIAQLLGDRIGGFSAFVLSIFCGFGICMVAIYVTGRVQRARIRREAAE